MDARTLAHYRLVVYKGDGSKAGYYHTKERFITLGSAISCDVRIKVPEAEQLMCKISLDDQGRVSIFLSQLNSKQTYYTDRQKPHMMKSIYLLHFHRLRLVMYHRMEFY